MSLFTGKSLALNTYSSTMFSPDTAGNGGAGCLNFASADLSCTSATNDTVATVGEESRVLLEIFVADRLQNDGVEVNVADIQEVPRGPPSEHIQQIASYLRQIGDQLDRDEELQRLIARAPPHTSADVISAIAREIFADGVFNWGRVVALFYFVYRLIRNVCNRVLNDLGYVRDVLDWATGFMMERVVPWVVAHGGWDSIRDYVAAQLHTWQTPLCCAVLLITVVSLLKKAVAR